MMKQTSIENEKIDYIDRNKLLRDIEKYHVSDGKFQHWVEIQPPVDILHWIPCSERMPDTSDEVLVTYILNGVKDERYVGTATWWADDSDEGGYWTSISDEYRPLVTSIERVAWMSQPKPYKGGE